MTTELPSNRCVRQNSRFFYFALDRFDGDLRFLDGDACEALLAEALGKSVSEAPRLVAREKPKPVPKDVTRSLVSIQVPEGSTAAQADQPTSIAAEQPVKTVRLSESLARKYITVDRDYEDLFKKARAALSHKMPGAAELDILKEGLRQIIKQAEKRKGIVDKPRANKVGKDGAISDSVKRFVEKRDRGKCQWPSEPTAQSARRRDRMGTAADRALSQASPRETAVAAE